MPVPVLTAAAMRRADQTTIHSFGIPSFTLMESAGRAAAEIVVDMLDSAADDSVLVLCGTGNNGGDGLVVARQIVQHGYSVEVVLLADDTSLSDDAAANLTLLRKLEERSEAGDLEIMSLLDWTEAGRSGLRGRWGIIIDALLGTGLKRVLEDPIGELVDWINRQGTTVVSIDVPTGLHSDRGTVLGTCVRADLTITMGAPKVGQLVNDGPEYTGDIEVVEIGIPDFALTEAAEEEGCVWLSSDQDIVSWFPERDHSAHKYNAGLVLAAVGSRKYTGAAVMSSLAALRMGAGYVVAGVPSSIKDTLAEQLVEVALEPLPETADGSIAANALETLAERMSKAQGLLVGCGIGKDERTLSFVRDLIRHAEVPGVLDADGLSALPGHMEVLKKPEGSEWILTPHWGEFRRLVTGDSYDPTDKVLLASRFAKEWGCVLIMKGMPSVVGCPDGKVYVNATGNPGLATAGTGDVLAGICAGLLAQGLKPELAAIAGLHIGGAAADAFAERRDPRTMIATDLIELIPETVARRF